MTVAAVCGVIVGAYLLFPADRSTTPLDRAPDALVVPGYFDPVFFQGQGFPVKRAFVASGTRTIDGAVVHVVPRFAEEVDYKSTQETEEQVDRINARFAPGPPWRYRPERRLGHYKCMATATSMLLDWFALERGADPGAYVSIFDGRTYRGFDPRPIDAVYYERASREPDTFKLASGSHADPVTGVPVPYAIGGFARIVEEETARTSPRVVRDPHLPIDDLVDVRAAGPLEAVPVLAPEIQWGVIFHFYPQGDSERVRRAIEEDGPLLAGIKSRFSNLHGVFRDTRLGDVPIRGVSGHGVVIVGWVEKEGRIYFLYRETFGGCDEERVDCGPAYRIYPVYGFNEIWTFRRKLS